MSLHVVVCLFLLLCSIPLYKYLPHFICSHPSLMDIWVLQFRATLNSAAVNMFECAFG